MTNIEVTDCPFYLISRASLAITSMLKRELYAAGVENVRPSYLGVLMSLWREDGLKAVELGRRAGLEPSTMTGLLDRMERDDLVTRGTDPGDRRAHRILLTDRGRGIETQVLRVVDDTLEDALRGVSETDQSRLKEVLRRLLSNTERIGKP